MPEEYLLFWPLPKLPKRKGVFFLKKTPDKNKKIDQVVEEIKFLSLFWPRVLTNLSKQLKIER